VAAPGSYSAQEGRGSLSGAVPSVITIATALVWTLVGLFVLRAVLTYALFDSLMDSWVDSRSAGLPREILEEGAPQYKSIGLASAVVIGGVLAAAAVFLARGAGWARIVATIFGVLGFLGGLLVLAQPAPAWYKLLGLIVAAVALAVVVMLWTPTASGFFRQSRQAR
jgi:hypothetical protein